MTCPTIFTFIKHLDEWLPRNCFGRAIKGAKLVDLGLDPKVKYYPAFKVVTFYDMSIFIQSIMFRDKADHSGLVQFAKHLFSSWRFKEFQALMPLDEVLRLPEIALEICNSLADPSGIPWPSMADKGYQGQGQFMNQSKLDGSLSQNVAENMRCQVQWVYSSNSMHLLELGTMTRCSACVAL